MSTRSKSTKDDDRDYFCNYIDQKLADQSANILEQMKALLEPLKEQMKEMIEPLQKEISSFRDEMLEIRQFLAALEDKVKSLKEKDSNKTERIATLETKLIDSTTRNLQLHSLITESCDRQEQYSRKDSLRVNGITFHADETNATLKAAVIEKLNHHGANISERDVYRLHRCGKRTPMNDHKTYINKMIRRREDQLEIDADDATETAEVLVKFTNWSARSSAYSLHYKKGIELQVRTDLTKNRQNTLKGVRKLLKDKQLAAYCYSNSECKLVLKDVPGNRLYYFETFDEFMTHVPKLRSGEP